MTGRKKEIVRHLIEDDLDRLLTETDEKKVSNGSSSSNRTKKVQHSKIQPTMSECRRQPGVTEPHSGTGRLGTPCSKLWGRAAPETQRQVANTPS